MEYTVDQSNKKYVTFAKPWVRDKEFNQSDVKGNLHVVRQNGLYIDKSNLNPRLENQIRLLALLSNSNFYKKQALDLSNNNNLRTIYLGDETKHYIHLPRGCFQLLKDK